MASLSQYSSAGSTSKNSFTKTDSSFPWPVSSSNTDVFQPPLYVSSERQQKFVESLAQRRERVEFLRRREWTRRIAEWIDHTAGDARALAHITHSWVDILAAADAVDDLDDVASPQYTPDESSSDEPYIIYTASPRSGPAPRLNSYIPSPTHTQPPAHQIPSPSLRRQRSARMLPRSRHSSLSSISEEDESALCL